MKQSVLHDDNWQVTFHISITNGGGIQASDIQSRFVWEKVELLPRQDVPSPSLHSKHKPRETNFLQSWARETECFMSEPRKREPAGRKKSEVTYSLQV